MNEAETRKQLIDRQLARAGWSITSASDVVCEYGIPLQVNPPGVLMAAEARPAYGRMPRGFRPNPGEYEYADYVLLGKTAIRWLWSRRRRQAATQKLGGSKRVSTL